LAIPPRLAAGCGKPPEQKNYDGTTFGIKVVGVVEAKSMDRSRELGGFLGSV
jgi:hypothetical protein